MLKLQIPASEKPVRDEDLIQAIELACSPVLGALNIANALGGLETDAWRLVREFKLVDLIDEAIERGLDLTSVKAACCDMLVMDTPPFHGALRYDPRPRCRQCNRYHFVRTDRGDTERSCGNNIRTLPEWRWTRQSAERAVEGTKKEEARR